MVGGSVEITRKKKKKRIQRRLAIRIRIEKKKCLLIQPARRADELVF